MKWRSTAHACHLHAHRATRQRDVCSVYDHRRAQHHRREQYTRSSLGREGRTLRATLVYPTKPPAMTRSNSPPWALALLAAAALCLVCAPAPSAAAVTAAVAGGSDAPPSLTTVAKQGVLAALCDNPIW